jgi:hypothetical protein
MASRYPRKISSLPLWQWTFELSGELDEIMADLAAG